MPANLLRIFCKINNEVQLAPDYIIVYSSQYLQSLRTEPKTFPLQHRLLGQSRRRSCELEIDFDVVAQPGVNINADNKGY
jgi:hypothetical protein